MLLPPSMVEKIAELDLRLDVGALNNMPTKKMKKVFSGVSGIEPQELGDIVKRMLDELALKRLPIGLYTLRIHRFDRGYLFRLDVGYLDDFIYPEFFGCDKKGDKIRYFSDS